MVLTRKRRRKGTSNDIFLILEERDKIIKRLKKEIKRQKKVEDKLKDEKLEYEDLLYWLECDKCGYKIGDWI
jgi:hypothetical protein